MAPTPGLLTSANWREAKLIRAMRVAVLIHSFPVCQPSTLGGSRSCCPIAPVSRANSISSTLGKRCPPVTRTVLTTISAGLLILAKVACLKKSELKSTRRTERMSYDDLLKASIRVVMASGSRGGTVGQAGTCGSSAMKKLYRCRAMKRAAEVDGK